MSGGECCILPLARPCRVLVPPQAVFGLLLWLLTGQLV